MSAITDDPSLQKRFDASIPIAVANVLSLLRLGFEYAPEFTVGVVAITVLVGYGHMRSSP